MKGKVSRSYIFVRIWYETRSWKEIMFSGIQCTTTKQAKYSTEGELSTRTFS
jgi:hypothetical protein